MATTTHPVGPTTRFGTEGGGGRLEKTIVSRGVTAAMDTDQLGHLAEETDGTGTMRASCAYDSGVPTSIQVGRDPATAPRDSSLYNGHGDVAALTDASGTSVATYGYDAWGLVTVDTEHFGNGWRNPYLYDGRDGARYDAETGLYWLSVRAYDPTLGRFLQHDPLGRAPLFFADQPYAYAGNNPLLNVDPTGQRAAASDDAGVHNESAGARAASYAQARTYYARPMRKHWVSCRNWSATGCRNYHGWMGESEHRRFEATWGLLAGGAGLVILGAALQMYAYWALFQAANDPETKVDAIANEVGVLAGTILPMLAMLALLAPGLSWVAPLTDGIAAAYNIVRAAIHAVRGLLRLGGALVRMAIAGFLALFGKLAGGWVGLLTSAATTLAGKAALQFAAGVGYVLEGFGWGLLTRWSYEQHFAIWDWCGGNRGQCDAPPASGYWSYN